MCTSVALLTVLLPPRSASAADIVVSGALERLLGTSIFVRLADDRLIDARLPPTTDLAAETIATHYSLGDQVEITCKSIQTVYDQDMALHQHLELKKLKLLRRASQEGLAQVVARLSRQGGANLLKHSAVASPKDTPATAEALLEHVRRVNLDFAANLPNFVGNTWKRDRHALYHLLLAAKDWRNVDVIESEVTFRGGRRTGICSNQAMESAFLEIPGPILWGVFLHRGGTKQHGMAVEHGGVTNVLRNHRLAQTVRAHQHEVASFAKKIERQSALNNIAFDLERPRPIEVGDGLEGLDAAEAQTPLQGAAGAFGGFRLDGLVRGSDERSSGS